MIIFALETLWWVTKTTLGTAYWLIFGGGENEEQRRIRLLEEQVRKLSMRLEDASKEEK